MTWKYLGKKYYEKIQRFVIMIHIIIAVIMMPGNVKENSAYFANKYHRIIES